MVVFTLVGFIGYIALKYFAISMLYAPIVVIDLLLLCSIAYFLFRDTIFVFHYTVITAEMFRNHIKEGNIMLEQVMWSTRRLGRETISSDNMIMLENFHREHTLSSANIYTINHDFISTLAYILVGVNIPINIILVYRFVYIYRFKLFFPWNKAIVPFEPMLVLAIICLQVILIACMLLPFKRSNAEFAQTSKWLPNIIRAIPSEHAHFKVKMLDLQYRLFNSEMTVEVGSTIGPRQPITSNTLLQVSSSVLVLFWNI